MVLFKRRIFAVLIVVNLSLCANAYAGGLTKIIVACWRAVVGEAPAPQLVAPKSFPNAEAYVSALLGAHLQPAIDSGRRFNLSLMVALNNAEGTVSAVVESFGGTVERQGFAPGDNRRTRINVRDSSLGTIEFLDFEKIRREDYSGLGVAEFFGAAAVERLQTVRDQNADHYRYEIRLRDLTFQRLSDLQHLLRMILASGGEGVYQQNSWLPAKIYSDIEVDFETRRPGALRNFLVLYSQYLPHICKYLDWWGNPPVNHPVFHRFIASDLVPNPGIKLKEIQRRIRERVGFPTPIEEPVTAYWAVANYRPREQVEFAHLLGDSPLRDLKLHIEFALAFTQQASVGGGFGEQVEP